MKKNNLKFDFVTDLELLDKTIFYLNDLCPNLPFPRLQDHCRGAMASLFELYFHLSSNNLNNYGNYEK